MDFVLVTASPIITFFRRFKWKIDDGYEVLLVDFWEIQMVLDSRLERFSF